MKNAGQGFGCFARVASTTVAPDPTPLLATKRNGCSDQTNEEKRQREITKKKMDDFSHDS